MLSESFIASSLSPPKSASAQSALLKDAGIYQYIFQPQPALRSTFKKSATQPNCLAVSRSHVFAAQFEKAVVHVYNREKGNQEATVPFAERIHSIVLAADETVLVLGTENGRLIIWETGTGRTLSTPTSHLQAINVLTVDSADNYVLSGSGDATVLVWSLVDLLTFANPNVGGTKHLREARHALSGHNAAVTAVACGHSRAPTNIAISTSTDQTAIVWDYIAGTRLRTILLPTSPLCVLLDPADRAAYAGYEDGSVQRIDFFDLESFSAGSVTSCIRDPAKTQTPLQPPASSHWPYPSSSSSLDNNASHHKSTTTTSSTPAPQKTIHNATLSLTLTHTATTLLTTHANGSIHSWDIATGRLAATLASYTGAPITNIQMLPVAGFPSTPPQRLQQASIVKPRPYETFTSSGQDRPNAIYTFLAQFPSRLEDTIRPPRRPISNTSCPRLRNSNNHRARFEADLLGPGLTTSTLSAGALALSSHTSTSTSTKLKPTHPPSIPTIEDDYIALPPDDPELAALRAENARLTLLEANRSSLQTKMASELTHLTTQKQALEQKLDHHAQHESLKRRRRIEARTQRIAAKKATAEAEPLVVPSIEEMRENIIQEQVAYREQMTKAFAELGEGASEEDVKVLRECMGPMPKLEGLEELRKSWLELAEQLEEEGRVAREEIARGDDGSRDVDGEDDKDEDEDEDEEMGDVEATAVGSSIDIK